MPQKRIPQLHFYLNGSHIDYLTELNCWRLTLDCNLNFKLHLKIITSRIIRLLHKLAYIFLAYLLRMISNSLILPHMNYSLPGWRSNYHSVKKAVRLVNTKTPVAHTEHIAKKCGSRQITKFVYFDLLQLYYKLYRNKLPPCLIIKRARVTLLPTHCIFICARLMLLYLPLLHTITTHNTLPHYYSLSFYLIRLIFRIYILTIVISNG